MSSSGRAAKKRPDKLRSLRKLWRRLGTRNVSGVFFRRFAVENGWPEHLRPREVQILNTLATYGPMSGREISERIGMPVRTNSHTGSPKICCTSKSSYLSSLARAGLIVAFRRPAIWMLTETAAEMVERRKPQCESK